MKKIALLSVLLLASMASAAVIQDFEGAYSGTGTVIADPTDASNNVLHVGPYAAMVIALGESTGTVTMDIYDFGEIATHGARWGVSDGTAAWAASVKNGGGVPAADGYANGTYADPLEQWWTVAWFGGPRQVVALDDTSTTEVFEGVGQWTTWTFSLDASGVVTCSAFGASKTSTLDSLESLFVSGGRVPGGQGVLVDNISFVPEPATLSMLALGGLAMLRRRK